MKSIYQLYTFHIKYLNLRILFKNMPTVIYCRVSSQMQNQYNKSVSLQLQEQLCSKFAYSNKMRVKSIYKEVNSSFNKRPPILKNIIKKKNQNIIIMCIDRYSRSVKFGVQMALDSLNNNNKLIFIQEKLIIKSKSDINELKKILKYTEQESINIGNRIKKSRSFLIANNMYTGGYVPYGYHVSNKKIVRNKNEQSIIEFIKVCMKKKITNTELNNHMSQITCITPYTPICCYDESGNVVSSITESLTNKEIVNLLNSYSVLKRGTTWNIRTLKTVINGYNKVNIDSTKLNSWCDIEFELDCITDKTNTVKTNNLGTPFDTGRILRKGSITNPPKKRKNKFRVNIDSDAVESDSEIRLFKKFQEYMSDK